MRKRQISLTPASELPSSSTWLDVEHKALVEVTSEENGFPIESALLGVEGGLACGGRRASDHPAHL